AGTKRDIERRRQYAQAAPVDITAPVYSAVLDVAEEQSTTIAGALANEALASFDRTAVTRAIEHLFALGYLNVLLQATPAPPPNDGNYRLTSALNNELLRDTIASPRPHWLASPVLGSPVPVPAASRLSLFALVGGDLEDAWRELSAAYPELADSRGNRLDDYAAFRAEIERGLPRFKSDVLPQLLRAGIVEARGYRPSG
ncbi:MAG: hypothetical protein R3305_09585, partial [Gammaproteobacteria bacterium]|nr:hypothetical protein [Gammaproteobacteria bacterium]